MEQKIETIIILRTLQGLLYRDPFLQSLLTTSKKIEP